MKKEVKERDRTRLFFKKEDEKMSKIVFSFPKIMQQNKGEPQSNNFVDLRY